MRTVYTITYSAEKYDEKNINKQDILTLINTHISKVLPQLIINKRYYDGRHDIESRARKKGAPNTRVICNHAKDIADNATGYFMGNPITYENTANADIEPLLLAFDAALVDDTDFDNALDMSIYGVAYEYIYAKKECTELMTKNLEPEHTFIVCDDTIEQNPLFGVYYFYTKDDATGEGKYQATVLTQNYRYQLIITDTKGGSQPLTEEPEPHYFGDIPLVEYKNNKYNIGDFEQQISLIDAYNTLMSDRVNDKEQFIDALLVLYGAQLGDDEEEVTAAAKALKEHKLLELPESAKAEYLTRTFDENGVETLRKAIKEDIYTFSHVPNLTDENFVGNSSGVAMEYKLLGLEMITKIKTRYYKNSLKKRIRLFCGFLGLKQLLVDASSVVPSFSRALPKNLTELAQVVANLKGSVSQKTLLQLLPFVEDPDNEIDTVAEEKAEEAKRQREMFGLDGNQPPDEGAGDVDE